MNYQEFEQIVLFFNINGDDVGLPADKPKLSTIAPESALYSALLPYMLRKFFRYCISDFFIIIIEY